MVFIKLPLQINGIFEYTRLSFGMKGGPSWFQQHIAKKVLKDLLYEICELYVDDIVIFGDSEDAFVANVTKVLERLREYNVVVTRS